MVEFYRSNYKELPNNPSYVKTWYHSDWDIKKIDEENGTISIIKKSFPV